LFDIHCSPDIAGCRKCNHSLIVLTCWIVGLEISNRTGRGLRAFDLRGLGDGVEQRRIGYIEKVLIGETKEKYLVIRGGRHYLRSFKILSLELMAAGGRSKRGATAEALEQRQVR
jgi:hypothetical protein